MLESGEGRNNERRLHAITIPSPSFEDVGYGVWDGTEVPVLGGDLPGPRTPSPS